MRKIIPIIIGSFFVLGGLEAVALNSDLKELNTETKDFKHTSETSFEYLDSAL